MSLSVLNIEMSETKYFSKAEQVWYQNVTFVITMKTHTHIYFNSQIHELWKFEILNGCCASQRRRRRKLMISENL